MISLPLPGLGQIKGLAVGFIAASLFIAVPAYIKGRFIDCGAGALREQVEDLQEQIAARDAIADRDAAREMADAELQRDLQEQIDDLADYADSLGDSCLAADDLDRLRAIRAGRTGNAAPGPVRP